MANNTKKISELGLATAISDTDRALIVVNSTTTPATRTVTFKTITTYLTNSLPAANSTNYGSVKVGNNMSINATGYISIPVANSSTAGVIRVSDDFSVNATGYLSLTANTQNFITQNILNANYPTITGLESTLSNYVTISSLSTNYVNTSGQYTFSNTITFSNNMFVGNTVVVNKISANSSIGTNGQVLTSNGSKAYWSTIVPQTQIFALKNDYTLSNQTAAQDIFGVGVTLTTGVRYKYKINFVLYRTNTSASTIKYALATGITPSRHFYTVDTADSDTLTFPSSIAHRTSTVITSNFNTLSDILVVDELVATHQYASITIEGMLDITFGGRFDPQIGFTSLPGAGSLILAGSYVEIYPIGSSGSNTNIGGWTA
jgi:hypothetical protein